MKLEMRFILLVIIFSLSVPAHAKQHSSSFGFQYEVPSSWFVMTKEDVGQIYSNEDIKSLGLTGYTNNVNLFKEILDKIKTGKVEFLFDKKYSTSDFNNNISIQLEHGRTAATQEEVDQVCQSLNEELKSVYAKEVKIRNCGYRELNNFGFVSYSYSGAMMGIETLQHEFQITRNTSLIVVAGSNKNGLKATQEAIEEISNQITKYFSTYKGVLIQAISEQEKGNYKKSLELLTWLERYSDDEALYNLGVHYQYGYGVEKSFIKAKRYYEQASELGNGLAITNLGSLYFNGNGVEKDLEKSAYLYKIASELGIAIAQTSYGAMLFNGMGVEKNPKEAIKWFLKAARQGNVQAGKNLFSIYKREVEAGNVDALQALAGLFFQGLGVEKDNEKGLLLLTKAAQAGNEPSKQALIKIYSEGFYGVTPNKELADQWRNQ